MLQLKWQLNQMRRLLMGLEQGLQDIDEAYTACTTQLLGKEVKGMRVSFFAVLGLVGTLAEELTKAAVDGKITVREAMAIVEKLCERLGIELDKEGLEL